MIGTDVTPPLWLALVPPAVYLAAVAARHLRTRPTVVSGAWDLGLLAAALVGLALVGPFEVLQPVGIRGPWRLLLPLLLFTLVVSLAVLVSRPRLVVYNVSLEQLRPIVAQIAAGLDPTVRWAGETCALPGRELQVHLDGRGSTRSVSLVAVGSRTSPEAWTEFMRRIRAALRRVRVRRSPWAAVFMGLAATFLATAGWLACRGLWADPILHSGNAAATTPWAITPEELTRSPALPAAGMVAHGCRPTPCAHTVCFFGGRTMMTMKFSALVAVCFACGVAAMVSRAEAATPLVGEMKSIDGKAVDLGAYKGKVVLVVNVASRCGYTRQYAGLQKLYDTYKDKDFVILGFPANDFGSQEPGSDGEIAEFCSTKYGVTFPMFSKITVKGPGKAPLYKTLTESVEPKGEVGWNFEKFLVGKDGAVVARFKSGAAPEGDEIVKAVEAAIAAK